MKSRRRKRKRKEGFILIIFVFLLSFNLLLGAILTKMVYNARKEIFAYFQQAQAFYLAEGGIEMGKNQLVSNPNWYTDLSAPASDDTQWLINQAVGNKMNWGEGSFKIIREREKNNLYAVGYRGKSIAVIKLKFRNPPFEALAWEEL